MSQQRPDRVGLSQLFKAWSHHVYKPHCRLWSFGVRCRLRAFQATISTSFSELSSHHIYFLDSVLTHHVLFHLKALRHHILPLLVSFYSSPLLYSQGLEPPHLYSDNGASTTYKKKLDLVVLSDLLFLSKVVKKLMACNSRPSWVMVLTWTHSSLAFILVTEWRWYRLPSQVTSGGCWIGAG